MTALSLQNLPPRHDHPAIATLLAVAMHALLLIAMILGLNWSSREPEVFQAELWASMPAPAPLPPPAAEPKPEPPTPPKPRVEPEPTPARTTKPDIALEKDKRKPEKREKPPEPEKPKEKLKEKPKDKPSKPEPKRPNVEKANQAREAAESKAAEAARLKELERLGLVPGGKGANATSLAAGGRSGEESYVAAIRGKVRSNIHFDIQGINGNPEAAFRVEQLPTGEIISMKLIRSSGNPAWDAAVERALRKSDPLPRRKDGSVERVLEFTLKPKESS